MKITPTNQWVYSEDGEWWSLEQYPTKQQAIEAGFQDCPYGCYVGSCYDLDFTYDDMDFSEYVIERLGECINNEVCDDESQVWYDEITWDDEKLLEDYLAKAIMKWIEDCQLQPSQYVVDDIEWIGMDDKDGFR